MTKKKNRKSSNKISNLTNTILSILKKERNQSFNYKQIAAKLGVNDASSRNQIIKKLHALAAQKEIEEVERGKFKAIISTEYHTGILDLSHKGSGYIICDAFDDDVFIASNNINRALNGDEVEFYVYKRRKRGKLEGEITQILKRAKSEYVGVIQLQKNYAFVVPDSNKMYKDIFVPINKINKAEDGDKVLVSLDDWPEKADSPYGRVIQVLRNPFDGNGSASPVLSHHDDEFRPDFLNRRSYVVNAFEEYVRDNAADNLRAVNHHSVEGSCHRLCRVDGRAPECFESRYQ